MTHITETENNNMAKPAKVTKKGPKTTSAKEIKAWLSGIQEFQPEGWTPSKVQWDAIREKIFNLEETSQESKPENITYHQQQQSYVAQPFVQQAAFGGQQNSAPTEAYVPMQVASSLQPVLDTSGPHVAHIKPAQADGIVTVVMDPTAEGDYRSPF